MHYQEQSKSSLLSPLTGYFLWALLPKEPRGKMGWFCLLCKCVYLGSLQQDALDAATSAPAPAWLPDSHPAWPRAWTHTVVSGWVAVNHSCFHGTLPNPAQKQANLFQRCYALTGKIPQAQSGGCPVWRCFICREKDLRAAARFAVQIKEEKRPPMHWLALHSISLLTDGLELQHGFSHWLIP